MVSEDVFVKQLRQYVLSKVYDKEVLKRDFYHFFQTFWVESVRLKTNWHLEAMCRHLEAVYDGDIQKLMILAPPRSTKSWIITMFVAWVWANSPKEQFLIASHTHPLAVRCSNRIRRVINDPQFRHIFGKDIVLDETQYAKVRFENMAGGIVQPLSISSEPTGYGGTYKIIDDPSGAVGITNDAARQKVLDWYFRGFISRNNSPDTRSILVMQRLHAFDLAGELYDRDPSFQALVLPVVFDGIQRSHTILKFKDPRAVGEKLDKERYTDQYLENVRANGENEYQAQYQQTPNRENDQFFKREDFLNTSKRLRNKRLIGRYIVADTAFKDKDHADYTAMLVVELTEDGHLHIIDGFSKRIRFTQILKELENMAVLHNSDGMLDDIIIEDKGSGTCAIDVLETTANPEIFEEIGIISYNPKGSKVARANVSSIWPKRGFIHVDNSTKGLSWRQIFYKQILKFPNPHVKDDYVDCLTCIIDYLSQYMFEGWISKGKE